jgi:para-nitrobenzyl esterase
VYLYHFEHPQPFFDNQAYAEGVPASKLGVFHSAEYPYVFGTLQVLTRAWKDDDYRLSELMQRYWTNFVKTGTPNGPDLVMWTPFSTHDDLTMRLGEDAQMGAIPRRDAIRFLVENGLVGDFL